MILISSISADQQFAPMSSVANVQSSEHVEKVAEASFPCRWGAFRIHGFHNGAKEPPREVVALTLGEIAGAEAPLVRIHSQCMTGEVFGSLRCDCGGQLGLALTRIAEYGAGVLVYDTQEGRGIGLLNKLRAYELQDGGADTVEANRELGFDADPRNYALSIGVLRYFRLTRIRLLSNNPAKVGALERAGFHIDERVPCQPPIGDLALGYLRTKKEKLGHMIQGL